MVFEIPEGAKPIGRGDLDTMVLNHVDNIKDTRVRRHIEVSSLWPGYSYDLRICSTDVAYASFVGVNLDKVRQVLQTLHDQVGYATMYAFLEAHAPTEHELPENEIPEDVGVLG